MSYARQQNEIKLDMLRSLARSQQALARMLESAADVAGASGITAAALARNIQVMTHYQRALLESVTGIRISVIRGTLPREPWIHPGKGILAGRGAKDGESSENQFAKSNP